MNDHERRTLHSQQQMDLARAREWWREHSDEQRIIVWERIQKSYSDPVDEIMSRFAQIGFTMIALEMP